MKSFIIIAAFLISIVVIDARRILPTNYMKNLNKSINGFCNKEALLITKTKAAEAEGNAIKISAEAERQALQLKGQGIALFREEVAQGMSDATQEGSKSWTHC